MSRFILNHNFYVIYEIDMAVINCILSIKFIFRVNYRRLSEPLKQPNKI